MPTPGLRALLVSRSARPSVPRRMLVCLGLVTLVGSACSSHPHQGAIHPATASSPTPIAPPPPPPAVCPLTGLPAPDGVIPARPVLGVKVENAPAARPQTGLDKADIVYEEPVEGGITRFLALYQCQDAARIEPVRSARLQDLSLLAPFPKPLFANAGGSPPTEKAIAAAVAAGQLVNVDFNGAGYARDPARNGDVHSVFTSTTNLYSRPDAVAAEAGAVGAGVPPQVFEYTSPTVAPTSSVEAAGSVHVDFSQYSDVYWHWDASSATYQRYYGSGVGTPSLASDGSVMSTPNLVIEEVPVTMSWFIEDSSGSHQPIPNYVGVGPALVCRGGSCVAGDWVRADDASSTTIVDATGAVIPLVPGQAWVELAPSSVTGPGPIPVAKVTVSP